MTTKNNSKQQQEKKNGNTVASVIVSGGVGMAAGAMVGAGATMLASSAMAQDAHVDTTTLPEGTITAEPDVQAEQPEVPTEVHVYHHTVETETVEEREGGEQHEIEVLNVEEVTMEDGNTVTIATVMYDGHLAQMIDEDHDNFVDVMIVDSNDDMEIQQSEQFDLRGQNMLMPSNFTGGTNIYYDAPIETETGEELAENSTEDYINDANVEDFMA